MSLAVTEVFAAPLRLSPRLTSELGAEQSTLRAAVQGFGAAVIAYVGGEMDAYNEDTLRLLLSEVAGFANAPQQLIVELNSVDFMSCSAFLALAEEATRCRERGIDLSLVSQRSSVSRLVDACGLSDVLTVHQSVPESLQVMEQTREQAC